MGRRKNKVSVLDNNNHSLFLLNYRLILSAKDCNEIIDERISARLKEIFQSFSPNYNITITDWDPKKDYIDIRFRAHPNTELSKFINAYKSAASRLVKKDFPDILDRLEGGQFWSKSFCLLTIGNDDGEEIIYEYLSKY